MPDGLPMVVALRTLRRSHRLSYHIRAKSSLGGVKVWSFLRMGLEHHFRAPDSSCKGSISRWWLLKDGVQCPFVVIQSYPVLFVCKALPFRRRRRLLAPVLNDMWQYDAETYSIINVASRASYSAALFSSSKSVFADNIKVANIGAWPWQRAYQQSLELGLFDVRPPCWNSTYVETEEKKATAAIIRNGSLDAAYVHWFCQWLLFTN